MTAPLTILGTGHAGYTLAKEWRRLMPDAPLRLITRDDGANYYKPNISKAFASGKDAQGLVMGAATQMAEQLKAEVLVCTGATRIVAAEHRIEAGAQRYEYSKLVLAVGAQPIRVPIAGNAAEAVHTVNDREDYARFRDGLHQGAHVLVVGAGLVGSEFTNDLAANGYRVTVVDPMAWPLSRLLPEACGRALEAALTALGVDWRWGCTVKSLETQGGPISATLSDGNSVQVDRVLSAVGLRPRLELAREAGIACEKGIVVDDFLQTSLPDIYALGDCIQINGGLLPFILPIAHASRALAQTLSGKPTHAVFPAMPVIVKTPACSTLVCPPAVFNGAWDVQGTAPDLAAIYHDADGKPTGFALTGAAVAEKRGEFTKIMPPVHAPKI
ncbi:MAG: FAD-dependent oxidoreductase [Stenotrophobium sp.]